MTDRSYVLLARILVGGARRSYTYSKRSASRFARGLGYFVQELVVETFGGLGTALVELIKQAAAMRGNKLTHGEYAEEATWSTRKYVPFVMQRISVAVQTAAASEIRQSLGMSLAA